MEWIRNQVHRPNDADYAQRVLDRYRLGMWACGAIRAVRIITGPDSCPTCQALGGTVYHPDEALIIPIAGCTHPDHPEGCCCAYTAVITYEETGGSHGRPTRDQREQPNDRRCRYT